jgi:hypothetical protein
MSAATSQVEVSPGELAYATLPTGHDSGGDRPCHSTPDDDADRRAATRRAAQPRADVTEQT